ncbi:polysaccharide export protein EpsE [Nitrosovibrio sp. Nv17]|uniref:polysaccharide export protein EpsE n=1 Tax=Nitrosovibrio sp. Nv17 TaxID=1855339 RepID=UPI000908E12F|nr:polysaccharide export protein EpsE [Nitrosovibrio sp. Nv17]SFW39975.1 polysaccharide export outer membrane protein [Nitrosovibrio sp. Nv17]
MMKILSTTILAAFSVLLVMNVKAGDILDYQLGAGDILRVQVFQNPELMTETRVSESGTITFPMVGIVKVGNLSIADAETQIADALAKGGFVKQPQVNIVVLQIHGSQVSVLGQVNRPGRFPLDTLSRISDMLAIAGGTTPSGDDFAIITGVRNGQAFRKSVDIPAIYLDEKSEENIYLAGGDTIYVHRAPVFYIYGEAQRPGAYRIERNMTVMQALAQGGGPTPRGSEWRLRLHRKDALGNVENISPDMTDLVQPNDVIYVRESIF